MRVLIALVAAAVLWPVGAAAAAEEPVPRAYCRIAQVGDEVRTERGTLECVREDKERPRWQMIDTPYTRKAAMRLLNTWPEFLGPETWGDLCDRYGRKPMAVRWYTVDAFDRTYPASVMLPISRQFFESAC